MIDQPCAAAAVAVSVAGVGWISVARTRLLHVVQPMATHPPTPEGKSGPDRSYGSHYAGRRACAVPAVCLAALQPFCPGRRACAVPAVCLAALQPFCPGRWACAVPAVCLAVQPFCPGLPAHAGRASVVSIRASRTRACPLPPPPHTHTRTHTHTSPPRRRRNREAGEPGSPAFAFVCLCGPALRPLRAFPLRGLLRNTTDRRGRHAARAAVTEGSLAPGQDYPVSTL